MFCIDINNADVRVSAETGSFQAALSFVQEYCRLETVRLSGWWQQGDRWGMNVYDFDKRRGLGRVPVVAQISTSLAITDPYQFALIA